MNKTKVDITRLRTFKNFADQTGYTVQRIYQKVKEGDIKTVKIDGVKFIKV